MPFTGIRNGPLTCRCDKLRRVFRWQNGRQWRRRLGMSLLLLAAMTASATAGNSKKANVPRPLSEEAKPEEPAYFVNYSRAYRAAQMLELPLLVVLNPAETSDQDRVTYRELERTSYRRKLLKSYVVVLIDTGTAHGQTCRELFRCKTLPHVVVIDKHQKWQIFKTSGPMDGPVWTKLLEKYKDGVRPVERAVAPSPSNLYACPT